MTGENGGPGVMAQMTAAFQKQGRSLLAVQEVPLEHTKRYGIVKGEPAGGPLMRIDEIVEKPAPKKPLAHGRGRPLCADPGHLRRDPQPAQGVGGEIQLTDAIERLMLMRPSTPSSTGKRYDCGSKEGFLQATVELALQHPDVGDSFREYLKSLSL
jgi:UTP--glucose-1-phosphate uridylyltransferase